MGGVRTREEKANIQPSGNKTLTTSSPVAAIPLANNLSPLAPFANPNTSPSRNSFTYARSRTCAIPLKCLCSRFIDAILSSVALNRGSSGPRAFQRGSVSRSIGRR